MNEAVTLRVGSKTAPGLLKSSIVAHIRNGKTVVLDSIGVPASYNATKGLILARGQLAVYGIGMTIVPAFQEVVIEKEEEEEKEVKTGIRWILGGTI